MGTSVRRRAVFQPVTVRPTQPDDPKTSKALDEIRASLPDHAVLDGIRLISGVSLTAGSTKRIAHGLGRKLSGWIQVRINTGAAAGYIYDQQSTHDDTDTYLYLRAEGFSPTISLLVF